MMRYFNSAFWGLLALAFTANSAQALSIQSSLSSPTVQVGDSLQVDIIVSDLGDQTAPSLGAFELDVTFDDSVLNFNSVLFGDPVLGDQLDLSGFGSFTDVIVSTANVNLAAVSFDLDTDLDAFQPDSFTLARLLFNATSIGVSNIGIGGVDLIDSTGINTLVPTSISGSVVTALPNGPTAIPTPALLPGLIGFGLGAISKKRNNG